MPATIKPLNRLAAATLSKRTYSAPSHEVFVTPRRVRFVESEYAVPRESLLDVLAELRAGVARLAHPVMFPVEVRVAAADDIWLSTAYGRDSAYVAIHQYVGLPYRTTSGSSSRSPPRSAGGPLGQDAHLGCCIPGLCLSAVRRLPADPRLDWIRIDGSLTPT